MRKFVLFIVGCVLATVVHAQWQTPGNCISYAVDGSTVVFTCEGGSKISLRFCSPTVIRFWYSPTGKMERSNPSFAVINEMLESVGELKVEERNESYEIFTSRLRVLVQKAPLRIQIFDKYQRLLMGDYQGKGHQADNSRRLTQKSLRNDEHFFGLGEKAGPLSRRGRTYTMWNSDKPCYSTTEDPLYKSIPFFISSYRYGVFFDNTYKTTFRMGSTSDDYYSFESSGGEMIYYFIHGNEPKQIISQYMELTGKPIMPPEWALGFSQSRGMYTYEKQALDVAADFRRRQIPCDIIYQDIGWTAGLQNFDWHPDRYTRPKAMLKTLDSMGFKMIVSQDPVVSKSTGAQWREADSLGYFARDVRTGKTYAMPWPWGGECGVVDFTRPEVADWWGAYQQKPIDDGVSGFWTDMGEPAWSNEDATERLNMQHAAGMHAEIHNVYGLTWDKVVKEQFEKRNPGKRIFQMTRSAYAGLQRYTFGWSGDSGSGEDVLDGWSRMANQVPMALSAGMGGIPFWATDISGYCGDIRDYPAMAELYTRWMQFGVFNPLSRAHHEGDNAVEPWLFGEEATRNCKAAIELKYQLFPYIYTYAREAHDKGWPLMRALYLEYPDDPETYYIQDQFLFGRELLVAPVLKKGAVNRRVYFPEGEWVDFYDNSQVYEGGQQALVKVSLSRIPLFVRKGSLIPMMPVMQFVHEKRDYPLTLVVYPAAQGQKASFNLYEDDGISNDYLKGRHSSTQFSCLSQSGKWVVTIDSTIQTGYATPGKRDYLVQLQLDQKPTSVKMSGKTIPARSASVFIQSRDQVTGERTWAWDPVRRICLIRVPANGLAQQIDIVK